ncbi:prepilin-type N-terminal cleavage/methylation domain-containing protein [Roseovarius aestuariivivens]|uniref:prepilin-type N-terminal cleavage/methylation domain-containing protein n=1 Tax=Roseovarius aestuariivivens TaxID=1888910 RepID=UPI0014366F02|nr:prepilin-type N-terminal cleavage/methylation domain-containing protein [Roseovarius aestuariivivens]
MKRSRGLSLLELVVAILVLSIGSIAALRATDQSRVSIGGLPSRVVSGLVARNRIQEARLYGPARLGVLPEEVRMAGQVYRITHDTETTAGGLVRIVVVARGPDGVGAQFVTYLPDKGLEP